MSLYANLERPRWRRAAEFAAGEGAARGMGDLSPAWADALAPTPEEAERMHYDLNRGRSVARAKAARGW